MRRRGWKIIEKFVKLKFQFGTVSAKGSTSKVDENNVELFAEVGVEIEGNTKVRRSVVL